MKWVNQRKKGGTWYSKRLLLPVLLAAGEAGKALGVRTGCPNENERECRVLPLKMEASKIICEILD